MYLYRQVVHEFHCNESEYPVESGKVPASLKSRHLNVVVDSSGDKEDNAFDDHELLDVYIAS